MKRRILSLILALVMTVTLFSACSEKAPVESEKAQVVQEEYKIKNVIMLIPDGGGYANYDFANDVKTEGGFWNESYANRTPANKKDMTLRSHLAGSAITLNYLEALTDSAAAGTALATGHKTLNGRIGVDHEGKPVANILEGAQSLGKSTGLVATYEWMHATPAAFSGHVMARDDYKNLYEQIESQGIDVVLGSGYGAVASYASIQNATDRGYKIVRTREDLENVKPGDKIWGDCTNNSSPYDINLKPEQPTLEQMTKAAITALSDNEKGFFLMVEGSKVDSGGHANDAVVTTSEYIAFDAAFKAAVDFAKDRDDTIVIAVPDHDTGAMEYDKISNMSSAIISVQLGKNPEEITWGTTSHSTQNVGVWMYLPEGIDVIEGLNSTLGDTPETRENYVIQNTDIAPYIASLIGVDLEKLAEELFVDVTDIGIYSSAVGKFTFNNGNKYVYKNKSEYYENGKKQSLSGMVTFELDGRFYVPSVMVTEEDFKHVNEEGAGEISGSGTKDDPYIIDKEWKFIEFTGNLLGGEKYEGKYFKQTADLDLGGNRDYPGIGKNYTFAGVYDGNGHSINARLIVDKDESIFPTVTGTVMNLTTTGKIASYSVTDGTYTAGVARAVAEGGKLINCQSTMALEGYIVSGIAGTNKGTLQNCYFGGTITVRNSGFAIASALAGKLEDCFYNKDCGKIQKNMTAVSTEELEGVVNSLNENRALIAEECGIDSADLRYWRLTEDGKALDIYLPTPTVSKVVLTTDVDTMKKGDGILLSAVVEGEYDPSQGIVWSVEGVGADSETKIYEDGYLYVAENENAQSFTIIAKSAYDGSVTDIRTIIVSEEAIAEPDGTRARPYKIASAEDFLEFTNEINGGNTLNGKYFVQTADIDMAGVDGYKGIPSTNVFRGIYDGRGYRINVDYESDADNSPFGTTGGVLMNIAMTGKIVGVSRPSGIVRKITHEGVVINCYSEVEVIGVDEACGLARSVYGKAANCHFAGTASATNAYSCTVINTEGQGMNNYSLGKENYVSGDETILSREDVTEDLAQWLNTKRTESAEFAGIAPSLLCDWEYDSTTGAVLVRK